MQVFNIDKFEDWDLWYFCI